MSPPDNEAPFRAAVRSGLTVVLKPDDKGRGLRWISGLKVEPHLISDSDSGAERIEFPVEGIGERIGTHCVQIDDGMGRWIALERPTDWYDGEKLTVSWSPLHLRAALGLLRFSPFQSLLRQIDASQHPPHPMKLMLILGFLYVGGTVAVDRHVLEEAQQVTSHALASADGRNLLYLTSLRDVDLEARDRAPSRGSCADHPNSRWLPCAGGRGRNRLYADRRNHCGGIGQDLGSPTHLLRLRFVSLALSAATGWEHYYHLWPACPVDQSHGSMGDDSGESAPSHDSGLRQGEISILARFVSHGAPSGINSTR